MWRPPDSFRQIHQLRIHERCFRNLRRNVENLIFLQPGGHHEYHSQHNTHLFLLKLRRGHIVVELFRLHHNLVQPIQPQQLSCLRRPTLQPLRGYPLEIYRIPMC